jgi:acetyl-CoA C-acetyltransferase
MLATQSIAFGERNIMVAGGMECMSKAPHYLYMRKPVPYGHTQMLDSI